MSELNLDEVHYESSLYFFRLVTIPESDVPPEIAEQLLGVLFPMITRNMDCPVPIWGRDLASGVARDIADAYRVRASLAYWVLRRAERREAAEWIKEHCRDRYAWLGFPTEDAEIVPGWRLEDPPSQEQRGA